MNRTTDITSFSKHRQHLRDHMNQVRSTGRPLYITTHGETEAVLLSPEAFDKLADRAELADSLLMLDRSAEDIRKGRTRPAKDAIRDIATRLGLQLEE